jgi:hypothetical protein
MQLSQHIWIHVASKGWLTNSCLLLVKGGNESLKKGTNV